LLVFATLWATIPAPALGSCRNIFFLVVVVVDHVLVVAVRCLVLIVSLVVVGCWLLIVVQALMLRKMGKEAKEQKIPTSRKQTNIKAKTKRSRKAGKEKKKKKHKHKGTKNKSKVHRSSHKEIKETLPR